MAFIIILSLHLSVHMSVYLSMCLASLTDSSNHPAKITTVSDICPEFIGLLW